MFRTLILFLIIFLEGYVVLSTELLAIRILIPFTGSGTDTISIVIAAVLMPLAFGYYAGGRFKTRKNGKHKRTVRKKLLNNLVISAAILTFGLSYAILHNLFDLTMAATGIRSRILLTTLYSLLFVVYPVFLLGQTVPLISNYFSRERLAVMAGRILFFSTLGSFMGAVICTLVFMTYFGVHYTVVITIGCLALLALILAKKKLSWRPLMTTLCLLVALGLNNGAVMQGYDIVENNKYHTIKIEDFGYNKTLSLNHNMSSGYDVREDRSFFLNIQYVERMFLDPLMRANGPPRDILIIGAGGFTVGLADKKNNYTYVDIDKDLLKVAEEKFLKQKLTPNKKFIPVPARAYLYETDQKYDFIFLDLFRGPSATPEHLVTIEFFRQVKDALKPNGIMAGNYLLSPNFSDPFSVRLDNTIRYVFSGVNRQVIEDYDAWNTDIWMNVIYSAYNLPENTKEIYTDDRNSSLFDKPGDLP